MRRTNVLLLLLPIALGAAGVLGLLAQGEECGFANQGMHPIQTGGISLEWGLQAHRTHCTRSHISAHRPLFNSPGTASIGWTLSLVQRAPPRFIRHCTTFLHAPSIEPLPIWRQTGPPTTWA